MKFTGMDVQGFPEFIKCRTCLGPSVLSSSVNITTESMLGKTIKEILHLFMPQMVKAPLVGDFMCFKCTRQMRNFANFIESCKRIEKFLVEESIKTQRNNIKAKAKSKNAKEELIHDSGPSTNGIESEIHSVQLQPIPTISLLDLSDNSSNDGDINITSIGRAQELYETVVECSSPSNNDSSILRDKIDSAVEIGGYISDEKDVELVDSDIPPNSTNNDDSDSSDVIMESIPTTIVWKVVEDAIIPNIIKDVKSDSRDTVVSVIQPPDQTEEFVEDISNTINIIKYTSDNNTTNKRILLLGNSQSPCSKCIELLNNPKALKDHFRAVHSKVNVRELESDDDCDMEQPKKTFDCPFCEVKVLTSLLLVEHLSENHTITKPFKCEKCDKEFKKRDQYTEHMMRFEKSPDCVLKKCRFCPQLLSSTEYEEHVLSHRDIVCDQCGQSFLNSNIFKAHYMTHVKEEEKSEEKIKLEMTHLCPICGKLLSNPQSYKHHMSIHGQRSRDYICHKCPKTFMTPYSLKNHLSTAHTDKKYTCPICHIKVRTNSALVNHHNLKHSHSYTHVCKICGKGFSRGDYYRRHLSYHTANGTVERHPGKKKYNYSVKIESKSVKCKYCLKCFKNVYLLRTHLLSHVKTMRYKCKFCNMTFANTGTRFRHQKRHADPNFDLSCTVCWKRMDNKEKLELHLARHDDSRKYECTECEERFASKYLLKHHMSEQHIPQEEVEKEKDIVLADALEEFLL